MNATIIGSQFGDEGKGAVVDLFSSDADVTVRFQGGDNAGHTVAHQDKQHKLRLIPSGVVQGNIGVLGNGCVINLETLFDEMDQLRECGLSPDIRVSERAHVVLPYHSVLDGAEEALKQDEQSEIGTTGNGIGPTYEDKASRRGIRVADLLSPKALRSRLEYVVEQKHIFAEEVLDIHVGDAFDTDQLFESLQTFGERLKDEAMVIDVSSFLSEKASEGDSIMFEGAQGTHLDIDHGNYPYVTSSNPTVGGAIVGTGVNPTVVTEGHIVGVVKAYLSRVGSGPMPTELDEESAADFREKVSGFGTVTGRPRRIGWLDLPMLRYAAQINGFTGIALNHIDSLAGLDELRICTNYKHDGETLTTVPSTTAAWDQCSPEYETFEPWEEQNWSELAQKGGYDKLPETARTYIEYVSENLDLPVYTVSIGPKRDETIVLRNPFQSP